MLETIRIRKLGFPIRREFKAFRERYRLLSTASDSEKDERDACKIILDVCALSLNPFNSLAPLRSSLLTTALHRPHLTG